MASCSWLSWGGAAGAARQKTSGGTASWARRYTARTAQQHILAVQLLLAPAAQLGGAGAIHTLVPAALAAHLLIGGSRQQLLYFGHGLHQQVGAVVGTAAPTTLTPTCAPSWVVP